MDKAQDRLTAIDLQLFADKTETATPRRRQEARSRGQVFRSAEVTAAVTLVVALQALRLAGPGMYRTILAFLQTTLGTPSGELTAGAVSSLSISVTLTFLRLVLPVLLVVLAAGVAANLLQVGFLFTAVPLAPNLGRINPLSGWQRLFSQRALVELLKALLKLVLVSAAAWAGIRQEIDAFLVLPEMELPAAMAETASLVYRVSQRMVLVLVLLAALDYLYQRWEHEQQLRMTKQEIKEEVRQSEGDPRIKARVRQIQRSLAMRRMMAEVPRADVVITNPTHYAVALRYDAGTMAAPVVVAKGADYLAARIRQIAREHGVTLVENKDLARGLYDSVDLGGMVPEALYQAVAEVLAFVYRVKGKF